MTLSDRDLAILRTLAHYYVLSRMQFQRLCFPDDRSGRATRRRLQSLLVGGLLNRTRAPVFSQAGGSPWPAYFPSRRGCEVLAEYTDDERFLLVPTQPPQPHYLLHWLAVSETHISLDLAIAGQKAVSCESWLSEWDVANKDETLPERRYRIFTLLRENPRLVCAPDAAFLLSIAGHKKVYYLEQDRNTSGVRQVAASKTHGYAALSERNLHRRHFPEETVGSFSVLCIAPSARRRDALRKAFVGKPGCDLWKFAAAGDWTPERILFDPVFFPVEGEPLPLVKRSAIEPIQGSATVEPIDQHRQTS